MSLSGVEGNPRACLDTHLTVNIHCIKAIRGRKHCMVRITELLLKLSELIFPLAILNSLEKSFEMLGLVQNKQQTTNKSKINVIYSSKVWD